VHTVGVRAEKPEDAKAIRQVNELAFGQPDEADLVEALRRSPKFDPELSRVFDKDGQIVGHILFSPGEIKTASGSVPVAILAPMSVHPDHQRHGIGERLVNRGLEVARERGHKAVVLVGHAEYYPRFGFQPASEFGIESPFPVPDESFMALELEDGALSEAAGMMEYPPEFGEII
jgi:putative acetyltransferase